MAPRSIGGITAPFIVEDRFSATLKAASDQIGALVDRLATISSSTAGIGRSVAGAATRLQNLVPALERISIVAESIGPKIADNMLRAMGAIDSALDKTTASIAALKEQLAGVGSATAAATRSAGAAGLGAPRLINVPPPSRGGGGGGGGGIRGGWINGAPGAAAAGSLGGGGGGRVGRWINGPPVAPGGEEETAGAGYLAGSAAKFGNRIFSLPALGMGFGVYEAFKQSLQTQYHITAGAELFDPEAIKNQKVLAADQGRLTALAFQTSAGTIYSAEQTAQAYDMLAAMLATAPAFQGKDKWQKFGDLAPIVLRASEVATMRNLGSLQDNMRAMTMYAHLTGAYTPGSMTAASNQFLAIAERTSTKLPSLERVMAYSLPLARGLGANMSDAALLTGALIQGGLGNRAGYAVGEILTGVLQTGGPITAAVQKALDSLGTEGVAYKGKGLSAHVAALHNLGILGPSGKLNVLNAAGGVDIGKIMTDIQSAAKKLSPQQFENALQAAFGIRGMRGAALLKAMDNLTPAFFKSVEGTATALEQQAAFAQTSQQQFEQMIARIKDIGNILATGALPLLQGILNTLVPILDDIDGFLGKHHTLASVAGTAALGAGIGWWFGGPAGMAVGAGFGALWGLDPTNIDITPPAPGRTNFLGGKPWGDIVHDYLFGQEKGAPQVTVNAPLTITVHGDVLDHTGLTMMLNDWWTQHKNQVTDAVLGAVSQQNQQKRRQTFLDPAYGYRALP